MKNKLLILFPELKSCKSFNKFISFLDIVRDINFFYETKRKYFILILKVVLFQYHFTFGRESSIGITLKFTIQSVRIQEISFQSNLIHPFCAQDTKNSFVFKRNFDDFFWSIQTTFHISIIKGRVI